MFVYDFFFWVVSIIRLYVLVDLLMCLYVSICYFVIFSVVIVDFGFYVKIGFGVVVLGVFGGVVYFFI